MCSYCIKIWLFSAFIVNFSSYGFIKKLSFEPCLGKIYLWVNADNEYSDKTAHLCSLIKVFYASTIWQEARLSSPFIAFRSFDYL